MAEINAPIVQVDDLEVSFKTRTGMVRAVRRANLTIERGQSVGLVGESGSGKSTLARAIPGLLPRKSGLITGGSIKVHGNTISGLSQAELTRIRGHPIAMVFQDPLTYLNPVRTVGKQISESVSLHDPQPKIWERVSELLDMVRLPPSAFEAYPHQLSGGMRQRALIAIALACRPELLIADEPTTALDVTTQAEIITLIAKLRKELGMSLLLISHDISLIAEACESICVMYAGFTIESGRTADVLSRPLHHYTRGLLAASLVKRDENGRFMSIPGELPSNASTLEGCTFRNRCAASDEQCTLEQPLLPIEGSHLARCCHPLRQPFLAR